MGLVRSEWLGVRGEVEVKRQRVQGKEEDEDLDEPQVPSDHHGALSLPPSLVSLQKSRLLLFFFSL